MLLRGFRAGKHTTSSDSSLPLTGDPLSSKDKVKDGQVDQRRYYDKDGNADLDVDYSAHSNPKTHTIPHKHIWKGQQRSKQINTDNPNYNNPDQVRNLNEYWSTAVTGTSPGTGGNTMSYSLEQLKIDLDMGREVMLTYNGNQYGITLAPIGIDGYHFYRGNDENSLQVYGTSDELIANATTVEGTKFQDIWDQVVVTDIY
jgi:hypothetical protein